MGGRFDKIFEKGGKRKMVEKGEEVSDECLAALRAASEVIGEKCKYTPPSPKGVSVSDALPFLKKLVKDGVYSDMDEAVKEFKRKLKSE